MKKKSFPRNPVLSLFLSEPLFSLFEFRVTIVVACVRGSARNRDYLDILKLNWQDFGDLLSTLRSKPSSCDNDISFFIIFFVYSYRS